MLCKVVLILSHQVKFKVMVNNGRQVHCRDHLPDNFRSRSRFRFLVKVQGPSGQGTPRGGCRYRNRNRLRNRSRNRNRCRNVFISLAICGQMQRLWCYGCSVADASLSAGKSESWVRLSSLLLVW